VGVIKTVVATFVSSKMSKFVLYIVKTTTIVVSVKNFVQNCGKAISNAARVAASSMKIYSEWMISWPNKQGCFPKRKIFSKK